MPVFFRMAGIFFMILVVVSGCETSTMAPPEIFTVQATLEITTLDPAGMPVSVPVTFSVTDGFSPDLIENQIMTASVTLTSDLNGRVEFSRRFRLEAGQSASIIADVSTEQHQSINYWTVYFLPSDAPGKQLALPLTVIPR